MFSVPAGVQSKNQLSLTQVPSSRKPIVVPGAFSRLSSVPDSSQMRRMYDIPEHSAQKQHHRSISHCSYYFAAKFSRFAVSLLSSTKP
jgi:hypothetical protein